MEALFKDMSGLEAFSTVAFMGLVLIFISIIVIGVVRVVKDSISKSKKKF
jgi:hypothetical protein